MFLTVLAVFIIINACHAILPPDCLNGTECYYNFSQDYDTIFPQLYQNRTRYQDELHSALNDHFAHERNNIDVMEAVQTHLMILVARDNPNLNRLFSKVCSFWIRKMSWINMATTLTLPACVTPEEPILARFLTPQNYPVISSTGIRSCRSLIRYYDKRQRQNKDLCEGMTTLEYRMTYAMSGRDPRK